MMILQLLIIVLFVSLLPPSVLASTSSSNSNESPNKETDHNIWLKERFEDQHQALIPIVAVADMFFS